MIGKIMFMREMIVMKLNEEEADELIGGLTLQFIVVVVFMMIYEKLFVKHRAVIVAQDFTDTHRGAGQRFFFGFNGVCWCGNYNNGSDSSSKKYHPYCV